MPLGQTHDMLKCEQRLSMPQASAQSLSDLMAPYNELNCRNTCACACAFMLQIVAGFTGTSYIDLW